MWGSNNPSAMMTQSEFHLRRSRMKWESSWKRTWSWREIRHVWGPPTCSCWLSSSQPFLWRGGPLWISPSESNITIFVVTPQLSSTIEIKVKHRISICPEDHQSHLTDVIKWRPSNHQCSYFWSSEVFKAFKALTLPFLHFAVCMALTLLQSRYLPVIILCTTRGPLRQLRKLWPRKLNLFHAASEGMKRMDELWYWMNNELWMNA